ncbi:MAG: GGDEF domain-containing protein [Deltaproteobacteria bacterium]|nr:GGDEF domain-containing protein [Deltaproteobacteria bacterium]
MTARMRPRDVLDLLLELTRRLTQEPTLEKALQQVTDAALRLLPGEHASVRVLDDSRTRLLCGARSGAGASKTPAQFRPGEGVAGWVVEHGEVARLDDTKRDPRFARRPGQGFRIRSILAVPLWSAGRTIGVLALTSPRPRTFDRRDQDLALLLANCAVPPIEKARLERLAITDQHTMAYNRRYLLPRLSDEIESGRRRLRPVSVLLLDLDRFKRVNDRWGHPIGDRVLKLFVDRIWLATRRQDALVRRGGDEFVLVLPGTTFEAAQRAAERIRRTIADEPFQAADDLALHLTVSIGLAEWNGRETAEELEARADVALYRAKHAGRNRVSGTRSRTKARLSN